MLTICFSMAVWKLSKYSKIYSIRYKKHSAKNIEWVLNDKC